jgi:N-hydroxyarylamine O-acetyltransferase
MLCGSLIDEAWIAAAFSAPDQLTPALEQNLLLRSVLITLGFQVTNLAARVLWNIPEGTITPRSHMLLRVDIDAKPYIVDVGFGRLTLTAPLHFALNIEQSTPHEPFRLVAANHTYIMQVNIGQVWKSLYRFDLQEQQLPDYEVSNWYLSNHPNSLFVTTLIAARPDSDCRYALQNNQFAVHYLNGQTERCALKTVTELRAVLEDIFRLTLPAITEQKTEMQVMQKRIQQGSLWATLFLVFALVGMSAARYIWL